MSVAIARLARAAAASGCDAQDGERSSVTSQVSTEARVPGVSEASIAANTRADARMSSAVSKYCRTTAVPCSASDSICSRLVETPGGGPPDSLICASTASIRSALTSVNLTTRTYVVKPPGLFAKTITTDTRPVGFVGGLTVPAAWRQADCRRGDRPRPAVRWDPRRDQLDAPGIPS